MATDSTELNALLKSLLALPRETEWVEFKYNDANPSEIGEYVSALANSACLHKKRVAYLVWGVEDGTHRVLGTSFRPRDQRVGGEELENWIARLLTPRIDFRIHEFQYEGMSVVALEIPPCLHTPVRFQDTEYIRIGTYKKKLKDYPEKERALWDLLSHDPFEKRAAITKCFDDEVLSLIDYPAYFDLIGQGLPANKEGILDRLRQEQIISRVGQSQWNITNLGAILFAKRLPDFDFLARKGARVIIYQGRDRTKTVKEQVGGRGYAAGFEGLIGYINDQLPRNEEIGQALRREARMYPEIAIRELVANAIIHQDFSIGGSPMVEVFSDRIEITNPGTPLIDTLRFIDEPPQSRNEILAAFLRRLKVCEERGSGIDKVIFSVELYQLPAPDFRVTEKHTVVVLFAPRKFALMDRNDRVRACYQHACLRYVSNEFMTNASLRKRFGIEEHNYAMASRVIAETVREGLVKLRDPDSTSKRFAGYVPFWA